MTATTANGTTTATALLAASLAPTITEPSRPNLDEVQRLLTKYNYDDTMHQPRYSYGTAGFRELAVELPPVLLRVGLAAAVLANTATNLGDTSGNSTTSSSSSSSSSASMGVMITASHNTAEYNGVKLAGLNGGMIDVAAETVALYVVNERDCTKLLQYLQESLFGANINSGMVVGTVHVGRDTRDHSLPLSCLVARAVTAMGCRVVNHGVVTTPLLHHAVAHANAATTAPRYHALPMVIPLRLHTAGYYDLLVHSYLALLATCDDSRTRASLQSNPVLTVDCACGVGYPHLQALIARLDQAAAGGGGPCSSGSPRQRRRIVAVNGPDSGPLNEGCGSEHVQKEQRACTWYQDNDDEPNPNSTTYCASLDGDADRIVFFSSVNDQFMLLDGDKMACLIGNFLRDQFNAIERACHDASSSSTILPTVTLGVVQTAYANGASTAYLRAQGVATCMAKTGVKYVHAAAHDTFDVGVYFEANGHGTVLFGERYYDFLYAAEQALRVVPQPAAAAAAAAAAAVVALQRLRVLPALINQAVGDALSDLLFVDAILQLQGWSIAHWATALYQDLPSRQLKVAVADRTVVQTNETETECLAPAAVAAALSSAVAQYPPSGRAFVRPSGTENVVRIYAEADTVASAEALALRAATIVHELCGGLGDAPPHSRM
jgi:phosphoacetylglucosamine mutase